MLPILIGGDPDIFWPRDEPVARLGLKGGFFHPVTGYSLPQAAANAIALAEAGRPGRVRQSPDGPAASSSNNGGDGGFYRLLNRMLFKAARPEERVRIFEHFYRLDEALVSRFYAGKLTMFDKIAHPVRASRPVPILRALKVIIQ